MIWLILILVYAVIGCLTYRYIINGWENTKFEKIWFSCVWITLLPLYVVHIYHNKEL